MATTKKIIISSQSVDDGINLSVTESKVVYNSLISVDSRVKFICQFCSKQWR